MYETDLSRRILTSVVKYIKLYWGGRYFAESVGGKTPRQRCLTLQCQAKTLAEKFRDGEFMQGIMRTNARGRP